MTIERPIGHDRESAVFSAAQGLLPEQLLPPSARQRLQPEVRLALAVLENAVETLRAAHGVAAFRAQRFASETWRWVQSDDVDHPFAFRAVCDHLGLDAEWLRRGLARWRPLPIELLDRGAPERRRHAS